METYRDGGMRFTKIGPLGPYENNAYIIEDAATGEALIVDAPADGHRVLDALAGVHAGTIVVTHRHFDHWTSIDELKRATGARVLCHEGDREPYAAKVDATIADGDELSVGDLRVRVLHTPGHTPGSICLLAGSRLVSGDTLFPGGPGRSDSPQALQQAIASITSKLLVLPDDTIVHPGHGADGTIGDSKREYAIFASREHQPDLCGDVTWEISQP
jgi:glyoxylase-like metal-dependent hydrolase (beta-lactamase superfamily II)